MRLSLGLLVTLASVCLSTANAQAVTHWSHTYHLKKGQRLHLTFTGHKGRALLVAACGGAHFRLHLNFPNTARDATIREAVGGFDDRGRPHTCLVYIAARAWPGGAYQVNGLPKEG
jgi:hypothetical protein